MATLYEEILSQLGKQASSSEHTREAISDLDINELVVMASELATLTGSEELAEMAKALPVYTSGSKTDREIEVSQAIHSVEPGDVTVGENEDLVSGPGGEGSATEVTASSYRYRKNTEKLAKDEEDDKDNEENEESKKKEIKEDDEDDKMEEDVEDEEVTATEVLYQILKEGAALEEMIEVRADELLEEIIKEAEDYEVAREVVDATATALAGGNAIKAHEYSEQLMDKVRTVAAAKTVPMSEAAVGVTNEVVNLASRSMAPDIAPSITPDSGMVGGATKLEALAGLSSDLEQYYEKIAEEVAGTAESMIREVGVAQGLKDPKLFEFVRKGMEEVKTLAARSNTNLAQAAQMFILGDGRSTVGEVSPVVPSPSQVPSPAKVPINSNQTQSPDDYIAEMISGTVSGEEVKEAAVREYIKSIMKQAMVGSFNT